MSGTVLATGTIRVLVGRVVAGDAGRVNDDTREVEFEGDELGQYTEYGEDDRGGLSDLRGVIETLYRAADARLVVHVKDWSRWQGEPTTYSLHEVVEADLQVGGRFEALGLEAGLGRPLTLDEALSPLDRREYVEVGEEVGQVDG